MKNIRDPGSPRVGGFWPWESLLSRILSGSRLEPWLEPLTLPAGAPWIFLIFFIFFIFFGFFSKRPKNEKNQKNQKNEKNWVWGVSDFFRKGQKNEKNQQKFFDFFDFFSKRPKNEKNQKNQKNEKNPGPWVSPRGGFLAVGIPPLPDPEWLQAGALAGALDSPCGGTLDFLIFFIFFIFLIFFEKAKKRKKSIKSIKIF